MKVRSGQARSNKSIADCNRFVESKTAVVTGGGGGIGVKPPALCAEGAKVAV